MHPIFERLKERKIVQWALAYLAGAVALYSALDAFAEPWGVGDFQLRIAQVGLLVGFFVALTLAWYHGERGEQRVTGLELLILAGIMGLGGLGIRIVWDAPLSQSLSTGLSANAAVRTRMAGLGDNQALLNDFEVGPKGTGVLYHDHRSDLWYRPWASLDARPIPTWSGAAYWGSPTMEFIVESSPGEVRVVPLDGDQVIRMAVEGVPMATRAGGDGFIYLTGPDSTIHRVPEDLSSPPEPLGIPREGDEVQQRFVPILGTDVGVFSARGWIEAFDRRSGRRVRLVEGNRPFPTRTGHLVWGRGGAIMAASFDSRSLEIGSPVVLIEGVGMIQSAALNYHLSTDGTLAYSDATAETSEFNWITRRGERAVATQVGAFNPGPGTAGWALSPDGSKLAHSVEVGGAVGIRVVELSSGSSWVQSSPDGTEREPGWIDDDTLLFWSVRGRAGYRQWRMGADGAGEPELVLQPSRSVTQGTVSPDGQWTLMRTSGNLANLGRRDIYVRRNVRDAEMEPLLASPEYAESSPSLSPDGTLLAYESNESGQYEVYLRPFPDVDAARVTISAGGGTTPQWAQDGSELFYINAERQMVAVRLRASSMRVESREALFDVPDDIDTGAIRRFSVSADGRFLMLRERREVQFLVLVQDWFEELERLVPH